MNRGRKLLAISGAVLLTFAGGSAAATGNLMAQPPKEPKPAVKDAGSADAGTPLQKTEAPLKKDGTGK